MTLLIDVTSHRDPLYICCYLVIDTRGVLVYYNTSLFIRWWCWQVLIGVIISVIIGVIIGVIIDVIVGVIIGVIVGVINGGIIGVIIGVIIDVIVGVIVGVMSVLCRCY